MTYLTSASTDLEVGDVNSDGILDIVNIGGTSSNLTIRLGNGNGTFGTAITKSVDNFAEVIRFADLNRDGVTEMVLGNSNTGAINVFANTTREATAALLSFSLKTRQDARAAQTLFTQKLEQLSLQRGKIGVFQSRTDVAMNSLTSMRDEYNAASSRIGDADIASAAGQYLRTQILQDAATAVLAQANQSPQIGLRLLEDIPKR